MLQSGMPDFYIAGMAYQPDKNKDLTVVKNYLYANSVRFRSIFAGLCDFF